MTTQFTNNFSTTLTAGIASGTVVLPVASAVGLPAASPTDPIYLTLVDAGETKVEIVQCTDVSGTNLTVVRAQDGTLAQAFDSGDTVSARLVRAALEEIQTDIAGKAAAVHTHVKADINDFSDGDYATAAQGALADTALQDITGENLTDLADTPSSLAGQAGNLVKVNPTEDGFIFGSPSGTAVAWGDITGTLGSQTDLQAELDAKSDTAHNHDGAYPPIGHSHVKADISDFSDDDYAAASHTHVEAEITDLDKYTQTAVDGLLENKQGVENGFEDRDDSSMSFTDGTRTFEIAPTGADYVVYSAGTKYTKSSSDSVVITDTEGLWFIYFDAAGVLQATQTFVEEIILDWAFVALVYWDATNKTAITLAEERHGHRMNSMTHLYNHNTIGTRYGDGLQVADVVSDQNGDDAEDAQFSVTGGTIWDEDIELTLASQAAPASVPFLYLDAAAGNWRKIAGNGYMVTTTGSGRAAWNDPDAGGPGVWGLTEVTNNDFLLMHLYATNDINQPFFLILGQNEYGNISAARDGALVELLNLETIGLPVVEYKAIASFIVQTSDGSSNAVKSALQSTEAGDDFLDWRTLDAGLAVNISAASLQNAAQVPFTPAGDISATDVQTALAELDTEKSDTSHTHTGVYEPVDNDILRADATDNLVVGFTTDIETLGSNTMTPDFQAENLKSRAVDGTVTINAPTTGNGVCHIKLDVDSGGPYTVNLGAGVLNVGAIPDLAANTVYIATVLRFGTSDAYLQITEVG